MITTLRQKSKMLKLSQNSVAGYWSTFRAVLAITYKERYLEENINDYLVKIEVKETKREFLMMEELNDLAKTDYLYP